MIGTPRRTWSWLADPPRRAQIEAAARRAYPNLRYRRSQTRSGPIHTYTVHLDVPGYDRRRVQVQFERALPSMPKIFADGPAGPDASPHRFDDRGGTRLCVCYHEDPPDRQWTADDGLLALFGMIAVHLVKEGWWREHHEWLGEEAPHRPELETTTAEEIST